MSKLRYMATAFATLYFTLGLFDAHAQSGTEPWKEPQDTFSALFEPDRYAWRLFVALNWPANVAQRKADPKKAFGADGPVVWESWRNVRPEAPNTVFRRDGQDPGPWLGVPGPAIASDEPAQVAQRFSQVLAKQAAFIALRRRPGAPAQPAPSFDDPSRGSEVRLSESSYEFIRSNELYNVDGQVAKFNAGETNLHFPPNAKEIKAVWSRIDPTQKPRYHWTEVIKSDNSKEVWGLTALHIITKDLPNWFWATFEHIDTKSQSAENVGWQIPSADRVACPEPPHDCEQAPTDVGLQGTKWEFYRLRGAQIDFITSSGTSTRLSNSQLEEPVQDSSCMTCHAMASINAQGRGLGFQFLKGPPQPSWFQDSAGNRIYMQQDFVFSLTRASRKSP